NLNGDQSSGTTTFITANGSTGPYFTGIAFHAPVMNIDGLINYGVPDSLLQPGDFHATAIGASPAGGKSFRFAYTAYHSLPDQTITLGPAGSAAAVTSLGTSPYLRLRAQFASQSAYNGAASIDYSQGETRVSIGATAGSYGGLPATWTLDIPDLTAAGYDPA